MNESNAFSIGIFMFKHLTLNWNSNMEGLGWNVSRLQSKNLFRADMFYKDML